MELCPELCGCKIDVINVAPVARRVVTEDNGLLCVLMRNTHTCTGTVRPSAASPMLPLSAYIRSVFSEGWGGWNQTPQTLECQRSRAGEEGPIPSLSFSAPAAREGQLCALGNWFIPCRCLAYSHACMHACMQVHARVMSAQTSSVYLASSLDCGVKNTEMNASHFEPSQFILHCKRASSCAVTAFWFSMCPVTLYRARDKFC